ncbi:MAG: ATP-binding cassette domain-containing protein, partial [Lentisphaeraceae bacterium]|nr:ATP-binding cassette domain-containing protein [Lentisphaeraceae bacterium]
LLKLAETCGIAKLLNKKPSEVSAGERQRAAVCRALITSPKIVLADEPTSSLDAKNGRIVTELLTEYCQSNAATLVMITHDQNQHSKFDKILDLEKINEAKND